MHSLSIIFASILVFFLPLYNIANCELLEEFKIVENFVTVKTTLNGVKVLEKSRIRLLIFRLTIFTFTIAFAFLTNKVEVVLNFSGAVLVPVICFYLPVFANFGTNKILKTPTSIYGTIHGITILLLSAVTQIFSIRQSVWCEILNNSC